MATFNPSLELLRRAKLLNPAGWKGYTLQALRPIQVSVNNALELVESERHSFCAPITIRWRDQNGRACSTEGTSVDVSVYGLGALIPLPIARETNVSITLNGVDICGAASVRHSEQCGSDFKIGMQLGLTLYMQNVPGIDDLLAKSLRLSTSKQGVQLSLFQKFALKIWRTAFRNTFAQPQL